MVAKIMRIARVCRQARREPQPGRTPGEDSQRRMAANWARAACVETDGGLRERLDLCETYYRMGKYDFMFGEASKLLPLHPDESDPSYWVGMGLYLNRRGGAKGYLEKSIALGLIGEKLQKARETLSKL